MAEKGGIIYDNKKARYIQFMLKIINIFIIVVFQILGFYWFSYLEFNFVGLLFIELFVLFFIYMAFASFENSNTSDIYEKGFFWYGRIFSKKFIPFESIIKIELIETANFDDKPYSILKIYSRLIKRPIIFDESVRDVDKLFKEMMKILEEKHLNDKIIHIKE